MNFIQNHINAINKLCKSHKVKSLYAFGSVLTDRFNDDSDIDLVVDFQPQEVLDYGDNYYDLKFSLQEILKRPVDLLEETAIKNPYFRQSLEKERQLIYENFKSFQSISIEELNRRIDQSEDDFQNGRFKTTEDLLTEIRDWK